MAGSELPSAVDDLSPAEAKLAKYVIPSPATLYRDDDGRMSIRTFILELNNVVPVHVHEKKDKMYVVSGPGSLGVVVFSPSGEKKSYSLFSGQSLSVRRDHPHYLRYFAADEGSTMEVMVASAPDSRSDVRWESQATALVEQTAAKQ